MRLTTIKFTNSGQNMSEITLHTINSDKKQSVLVCLEHSIESNYLQARALLQEQGHAISDAEKTVLASKASELLHLDAVSGHADAQYLYAQCLRSGTGLEKDVEQSLVWLKHAADQQHEDAQFELAMLLPLEDEQHLVLLDAAAQQGHVQAILCMAVHEKRQLNMPKALYWLNIAKNHQIPCAYYLLAQLHRHGNGVDQCPVQTVNFLTDAAELGHVDASFELFQAYNEGYGVNKDKPVALKYLQIARNHQHLEAASIEFEVS